MNRHSAGLSRLHALDLARAGALILGIGYHAAASFMPGPAIWIVEDSHRSVLLSLFFFTTHMFRMTLFFLIAGFFAPLMIGRRGLRAFVANRLKRIAVPLVVFLPISLFSLGAVAMAAFAHAHPGSTLPPTPALGWRTIPLTHLWFLYLLLLLYAGALVARFAIGATDPRGRLANGVDRGVLLLEKAGLLAPLLATPAVMAFLCSGRWSMWFGVPTPDVGLLPNAIATIAYGTAFGFGWLVFRQNGLLQLWAERWWAMLLVAISMTGICIGLAGATPSMSHADDGWPATIFAICYALGAWSWARGIIGACVRFATGEDRRIRYVADASYWMYLIHLPIVATLQFWLSDLDLPAVAKFAAILLVGLPLMLGSYAAVVRRSWIGAWLSGTRREVPTDSRPARKLGMSA